MLIKRSWPITGLVILSLFFSVYLIYGQAIEKANLQKEPEKPVLEKSQTKQTKEGTDRFLRITRDAQKKPIALETSIVRYVPKDRSKSSPTVDLISAVHIGERGYYDQLNREFKNYDAVLYEIIAPTGTKIPKGGGKGSGSMLSMIQKKMKDVLELEFQLELVDYTQPNFVHADMSPTQFAESMDKRGDSMLKMFIRMMSVAMAQENTQTNGLSEMQLLMALFNKNRAMALKRAFAEQFQSMDGMLLAIDGPNGSTIVTDRNKIALDVLRKEINKGNKKLAIFYGGAHMPNFDKQLREQFNLIPSNTRWLTAWNLKQDPKTLEKNE